MQEINFKKDWLKFLIGWMICLAIRLLPFRPPNVEPILTTTMPFSKKYGLLGGFIFGFLSIVIYDLIQNKFGSWTWITGILYGLLGVFSYFYFKNRESKAWNYFKFAMVGTIIYDAISGLGIGTLMFGQSLSEAAIGQIPFTLMHLAGNLVFAVVLSPLVYKLVVANDNLSADLVWKRSLNYLGIKV